MDSSLLLIDLLGAAALLLFGLRLLKSGVGRAFGARLRQVLASGTRNRVTAFATGLAATLALQSSTAVAMMISSFVAQDLVAPAMAQAILLGANVGTALVAKVLSLDLHWLAPALILTGVVLGSGPSQRRRSSGEIVSGVGLMLLSLRLMAEATEPMRQSQAFTAFFGLLGNAPIVAIGLSAALAAGSASSLAIVLFTASLAAGGTLSPELCLLLVAGANLGGAVPPVLAATPEGEAARRVALFNLAVRGIGALILLVTADRLVARLPAGLDPGDLVIWMHIAFNVALAAIFLPLIGPMTRILNLLLPDKRTEAGAGPRHLDDGLLTDPPSAIAAAMRETMHVGDLVQRMLETTLAALQSNDALLCEGISRLDDEVDAAQEAVKLYVARIDGARMDDMARRQMSFILAYATDLEHVGDIVDQSLARLTVKKIERQLRYSPEGLSEIEDLFRATIDHLQLAQRVFLNSDVRLARRLMEGKVAIRRKERDSVARHMARLQSGRPETVQTTSLHMDVLRDLKRINAHLMSVAAPILEEAGQLRESRLRKG